MCVSGAIGLKCFHIIALRLVADYVMKHCPSLLRAHAIKTVCCKNFLFKFQCYIILRLCVLFCDCFLYMLFLLCTFLCTKCVKHYFKFITYIGLIYYPFFIFIDILFFKKTFLTLFYYKNILMILFLIMN